MTFREIWRSGYVTRYHARPEVKAETLAEHHARTAQILCELYFPRLPSAELLFAALHHDVGELIAGDLPYPFKVANPDVADAHRAREASALLAILRRPMPFNSRREMRELALADRIAAYLYGFPQDRENPEWGEEWGNIVKAGKALGYDAAMSRILETVRPARDPMDALIREAEAAGLYDIAPDSPAPDDWGDNPAEVFNAWTAGRSDKERLGAMMEVLQFSGETESDAARFVLAFHQQCPAAPRSEPENGIPASDLGGVAETATGTLQARKTGGEA